MSKHSERAFATGVPSTRIVDSPSTGYYSPTVFHRGRTFRQIGMWHALPPYANTPRGFFTMPSDYGRSPVIWTSYASFRIASGIKHLCSSAQVWRRTLLSSVQGVPTGISRNG